MGETPYSLAFGAEAVIPVEVGIPTHRVDHYTPRQNTDQLTLSLDLLEEHHLRAALHLTTYQQCTARYYDQHVCERNFCPGDLVLRKVLLGTKDRTAGTLGANWEGPYRVVDIARPGTYRLAELNGKKLLHPWNIEHIRKYYS
ncbi:unnamed protein product [Prunus armeniaca]